MAGKRKETITCVCRTNMAGEELGVGSVECGVWSVELGVWSVELGVWSVELGVWREEGGGRRKSVAVKFMLSVLCYIGHLAGPVRLDIRTVIVHSPSGKVLRYHSV